MGLARGLGGRREGDAREADLRGARDLVQAEVAALRPLGHAGVPYRARHVARARCRAEARGLAVLSDPEGAGPLGVQLVAPGRAGLADLVVAIGERVFVSTVN